MNCNEKRIKMNKKDAGIGKYLKDASIMKKKTYVRPNVRIWFAVLHSRNDLHNIEGRCGLIEVNRARDGRIVGSRLQLEVTEMEDSLPDGRDLARQHFKTF